MTDQVILVNEFDEQIGVMDKFAAHRQPPQRHRCSSVWLVDGEWVLLQQRSQTKIVGAGWWANAACGNVWPQESYEQCGQRRLQFELGVEAVPLREVGQFTYRCFGNREYGEFETDHVFRGDYQQTEKIEANPAEVSALGWAKLSELQSLLAKIVYPTAAQTLAMTPAELEAKTQPVELEISMRSMPERPGKIGLEQIKPKGQLVQPRILLTPWTVIMVRDSQLMSRLMSIS